MYGKFSKFSNERRLLANVEEDILKIQLNLLTMEANNVVEPFHQSQWTGNLFSRKELG